MFYVLLSSFFSYFFGRFDFVSSFSLFVVVIIVVVCTLFFQFASILVASSAFYTFYSVHTAHVAHIHVCASHLCLYLCLAAVSWVHVEHAISHIMSVETSD